MTFRRLLERVIEALALPVGVARSAESAASWAGDGTLFMLPYILLLILQGNLHMISVR